MKLSFTTASRKGIELNNIIYTYFAIYTSYLTFGKDGPTPFFLKLADPRLIVDAFGLRLFLPTADK